jgi:hypothetical protein
MPTPEQLRKLSEQGKKDKAKRDAAEAEGRKVAKAHMEAEKAKKDADKAKKAVANAEASMEWAANDGLSAVLVYHIERDDVVEFEEHSLGTGSKVDTVYNGEKHSCRGAAKIVIDHFKSKGFQVVIVAQDGPYDPEGPTPKEYYVKVGW